MARRVDLIDQFTELVVGADDPRRLAERTLEVIMSLLNGRSGAVFTGDTSPVLFASRGIDQAVLDIVPAIWSVQQDALRRGEILYVADCASERRIPGLGGAERPGPASLAVVPVLQEERLLALLYVDSQEPHFCDAHDIERLAKFSRIIAKSVTETASPHRGSPDAWETYLERTPVEDMEREKLLLLLNRNEWNIARVARMMGVTRRTVYLRLQRYNIPRERVPKSRLKSATAS
ncbi:MAG TPA: GAF domain-containing protein [Vicinamibacteria bacterium]|nr:GAF domain-containing protein [Vicinamibacteria bacterium]